MRRMTLQEDPLRRRRLDEMATLLSLDLREQSVLLDLTIQSCIPAPVLTDERGPMYASSSLVIIKLNASTSFHDCARVQNLPKVSVASHKVLRVQGLIGTVQNLLSEVVRASKGDDAGRRGQEERVVGGLNGQFRRTSQCTQLTSATIFFSMAIRRGTPIPNAFLCMFC
jgi:hypothetical protein